MYSKTLLLVFIAGSISCDNGKSAGMVRGIPTVDSLKAENVYQNIGQIPPLQDFTRIKADSNSFAGWLRNIHLKKDKTVLLYNGQPKINQSAQYAVLDISVGDKDLQQCADAVMRLRAEYLFTQKKYTEIQFKDNAGKVYQFIPPYTKANLDKFMQTVFGMCGSASLSKQLKPVDIKNIEPGDVFIRGGFPGHAEIVVDVAINNEGEKIFMLAQSYMPAQDIHIVINPVDEQQLPWYKVNNNSDEVFTPEYIFKKTELKRWE